MQLKFPWFRKKDKRSFSLKDPKKGFFEFFNPSRSSIAVTEDSAKRLAVYWRCLNIITSTVAGLPLKMFQDTDLGKEQVDNPAIRAVNNPNPNITSFTYNEILVGNALNFGNGYAVIERFNTKIELHPVHSSRVQPFMFDDEIFYNISTSVGVQTMAKEDVIHLRGYGTDILEGDNVLNLQNKTISLGLAAQQENVNFYEKGARLDGFVSASGKIDDATKQGFRDSWQAIYGISGNSRTALLDQDMKYVPIGVSPKEALFLEAGRFNDNQIATIFGVPIHMVNQLERATHSNIEHEQQEFVTYTMLPWLNRLEQEYQKKLLPEGSELFFKFNVNALLRGDAKSRSEFLHRLLTDGVITIDEAREKEDLNKLKEGGDVHRVPLNVIGTKQSEKYYDTLAEGSSTSTNIAE